nr:MAG TPA: hypothetical protein [Caudoviricetes sp.]
MKGKKERSSSKSILRRLYMYSPRGLCVLRTETLSD